MKNLSCIHAGRQFVLFVLFLSISCGAQVSVTTYHNDISRTGQNTNETILTPANVNSSQFGRLFYQPVDGYVYAQPLYMPNVTIGGVSHNVVYVATEHDSVYAFDADNFLGANANPLWKVSLIPNGGSTVNSSTDLNCADIVPEVGITSTPVIDASTGILYVVAKTKENGNYFQRLHALDIATGADKVPATVIAATFPNPNGGNVTFDAFKAGQRPGLLLQNGLVYIGWASHCDHTPYYGWVIAYDRSTLAQVGVFNAGPANGYSGVWMGGSGIAGDGTNVYFSIGNGTFNITSGGEDYGDSILKLGPPSAGVLPVLSYFTPWDQSSLQTNDTDLGSGGVLLLPRLTGLSSPNRLFQVGKSVVSTSYLHLIDRDNMGGYCNGCSSDTNIVQEVAYATGSGIWGMPAYWNKNIYVGFTGDHVKAFSFNALGDGFISTAPTSQSNITVGTFGPTPSVSSNGTSNGIVWVNQTDTYSSTPPGPSHLHAFDANNLATELYQSQACVVHPDIGGSVKFTVPTIANGKVYIGTAADLEVFGPVSSTATPIISLLNPFAEPNNQGAHWDPITIFGTGFGPCLGNISWVGRAVSKGDISSWTDTKITFSPTGTNVNSGVVYITSNSGHVSNSVPFTVTNQGQPTIANVTPSTAAVGQSVTITGYNFGSTGTVKFNGTTGGPTSWGASQIVVPVPIGATSGNIVVTVSGVASNSAAFTVQ